MIEAVLHNLLDRTQVSRLDVDSLLDLCECALAKAAVSFSHLSTDSRTQHLIPLIHLSDGTLLGLLLSTLGADGAEEIPHLVALSRSMMS